VVAAGRVTAAGSPCTTQLLLGPGASRARARLAIPKAERLERAVGDASVAQNHRAAKNAVRNDESPAFAGLSQALREG